MRARLAIACAVTLAIAAGIALADAPALLNGWRLAVTLTLGLAIGSMILVAIGRLLDNRWRHAIEDELLPAAWLLVPITLAALPLLLLPVESPDAMFGPAPTPMQAAWFTPVARVGRLGGCLIALFGALVLMTRSERQAQNAIALALTSMATLVAIVDWVMPIQPLWWSTMIPFATVCSQLSAAVAVAFVLDTILNPRRAEADIATSLGTALLAMALGTIWVWFAQYLTAWSMDLPNEAAWYAARRPAMPLLAAAATLQLGAIAALIVLRPHRGVALLSSLAMLGAHALHSLWFFRPGTVHPAQPADFVAGGAMIVVIGCWLWFLVGRFADRDVKASR